MLHKNQEEPEKACIFKDQMYNHTHKDQMVKRREME